MNWGINTKKYLNDGNRCKYYGDNACPCVSNKAIRKQYDKKNGYWANGAPLPECENCNNYDEIDPDVIIPISCKGKTSIEREICLLQYRKAELARKVTKTDNKDNMNTPVQVELLNATGGTAGERLSKAIIGGALFGRFGAIIGMLGSDKSNVKLIFKVYYADGRTETVVKKANSRKAKRLLELTNLHSRKER
ncbi:MAG: hypothetical protein SOX04_00145 [Eubacteriales bacterium]|nr:hypothetical protein [Christensenellaceae bacterium]MDY3240948.1 hypothetical protein [Eubacteriales bacterium]